MAVGGVASRLELEVEPGEVGLDPERLARIDRHLARYVDAGRIAGTLVVVARGGRIAHLHAQGVRDPATGLPVELDTIWRIYSMTKPITSVAAMMLYEEGAFELTDPVSRFIPAFADTRVYSRGPAAAPVTVPAVEPIRIWHLLSHTAGLTYGLFADTAVDHAYRAAGIDTSAGAARDLESMCERLAELPLAYEPGTSWNYSVATDVLGRVVEVASGLSLDRFFEERIFAPLGMTETGFHLPAGEEERLVALTSTDPATGRAAPTAGPVPGETPRFLSGGGGLLSTARDYHRFTQMLLRGGELDGARLLGPRTLAYMVRNHLPGGVDLGSFGAPLVALVHPDGIGFGLGFAVVDDPAANKVLRSQGEYFWGGAAGTAFWIDPAEELTVLFCKQLLPALYEVRDQLRQLVYQAIVD